MSDARGVSDLMMNFLVIGWWLGSREWAVDSGQWESLIYPFPTAHCPLPTASLPQSDDRRVLDVGDGAVIFAEQSQVGHDQFVAAALVKINHSPAQRKPFAVLRQSAMPRVARGVNPRAERNVAHQNFVGLRNPERRMADGAVNRRCFDDVVEELC